MLTIGVVNNIPTAAIRSTERQFTDILMEAAGAIELRVRWFRLVGARPDHYESSEALWNSDIDGLIVTGAEPRSPHLPDEPFWQPLTKTIDWARRHTRSVIWSCLATHAAVLHLDNVQRHRAASKVFGVFPTHALAMHSILDGLQRTWQVPHSRWNGLNPAELSAAGYDILSISDIPGTDSGVDTFVKIFDDSLFLFIQSHPEYDIAALLREFRRDIARYQLGQIDCCPELPKSYFQPDTAAILSDLLQDRSKLHQVNDVLEQVQPTGMWKAIAVQKYRNWLGYMLRCKSLEMV